jgi:ABC-type uncharacterized transport system substrate-binding protein
LQAAHHSQRRFPSRRCATKRRSKRPQQHSRASQGGGLIAAPDPFINTYHALIISSAHRNRLPTLFGFQKHVRDGGLMSYGPNSVEIVRQSASYVGRILKGDKPAELPVQGPTKYELAITQNG